MEKIKTKVIGIGGCGCNIVDNICRRGVEDVGFALVNRGDVSTYKSTAQQHSVSSDVRNWEEALRPLLTDMPQTIILVAGMGGEYSAQVVSALCRLHKTAVGHNAQTLVFAVKPFRFESRDKKASEDIDIVSKQASRIVTFDNNSLMQYGDRPMAEVFGMVADEVYNFILSEIQQYSQ